MGPVHGSGRHSLHSVRSWRTRLGAAGTVPEPKCEFGSPVPWGSASSRRHSHPTPKLAPADLSGLHRAQAGGSSSGGSLPPCNHRLSGRRPRSPMLGPTTVHTTSFLWYDEVEISRFPVNLAAIRA